MIFNSFTVANDYTLAHNDRTAAVVAFSCRQIKLLEPIFFGSCKEISSKGVVKFYLYLKSFCKKRSLNLVLSLFMNKSTK